MSKNNSSNEFLLIVIDEIKRRKESKKTDLTNHTQHTTIAPKPRTSCMLVFNMFRRVGMVSGEDFL
jgi:hypothetical protein